VVLLNAAALSCVFDLLLSAAAISCAVVLLLPLLLWAFILRACILCLWLLQERVVMLSGLFKAAGLQWFLLLCLWLGSVINMLLQAITLKAQAVRLIAVTDRGSKGRAGLCRWPGVLGLWLRLWLLLLRLAFRRVVFFFVDRLLRHRVLALQVAFKL
jgi:hypothetical protein